MILVSCFDVFILVRRVSFDRRMLTDMFVL